MKAVQLRNVDMDYRIHMQAFLNHAVRAEKSAGKRKRKPVYKTFDKFYNYKKEVDRVMKAKKEKSRFSGIGKLLKRGD